MKDDTLMVDVEFYYGLVQCQKISGCHLILSKWEVTVLNVWLFGILMCWDLSSTKLSQTTFTHCHFISICIVIFILETISASFSRYNIIRIKCPIDWHALLELFVSHSVGRRRDRKKAEAKRKKCNWKFVENWDLKCFAYSFSALSHQT